MLDLDDIINHQSVSVSQNKIQLEKWKIWEMVGSASQKLHNEISTVGLSSRTNFLTCIFHYVLI